MIRLNDINKTVIDEKEIKAYSGCEGDLFEIEEISLLVGKTHINFRYDSKETRDKDIELLDKIFDVKDIEYKANAYPHELDALKFAMSGMKQESKLVSEGEYDPVKKEEYLTWDYVRRRKPTYIKALLNGKKVHVVLKDMFIRLFDEDENYINATIYDEDLFNALMLKKVE